MASRQSTARKQIDEPEIAPPASQGKVPLGEMNDAEAAKLVADIENFLNRLGIDRNAVRGIPNLGGEGPTAWEGLSVEQRDVKSRLLFAIEYADDLVHPERSLHPEWRQTHMVLGNPDTAKDVERATDAISHMPPLRFAIPDPVSGKPKIHFFSRPNKDAERTVAAIREYLDERAHLPTLILAIAERWARSPLTYGDIESATASAPTRDTEHPTQTDERRRMLDYNKSFIQDGVRYFPLSAAAPVVQAPRSTLLHWIKKDAKFNGRPLESYYFAPANQYFISEESIERAANRFIKWPSQEPAGPASAVILGETSDQSGYIGLSKAADTLGVDHRTMWLWATQEGKAPTDTPPDVIKCPASDQYYIRESDVSKLKKFVPRAGLRRGRRRQLAPQPT